MSEKALRHEEIWDDSYLVQSWDEALEEYKKYHSIAAKGEDAEAILDQMEADQLALSNGNDESNEAEEEEYEPEAPPQKQSTTEEQSSSKSRPATGATHGLPQAVMGAVQDESLRNLMMSWYYAGYYTGFHEGQQQAFAQSQGEQ